MTPSEENLTAWIDGCLSEEEAGRFEKALGAARPGAEQERAQARRLGELLRRHWKAPELANADFFNHQLLARLEAEAPRPVEKRAKPAGGPSLWRLLAAAAACCVIVGAASLALLSPVGHGGSHGYYAQILNARPGDSRISAKPLHNKKANVTVLWLDGLDRVSSEGRK